VKFLKKAAPRNFSPDKDLQKTVAAIIDEVREQGDAAVLKYSKDFDGCGRERFRVDTAEIAAALGKAEKPWLENISVAIRNIRRFAEAQRATILDLDAFSPEAGTVLGHRVLPVNSALCYVPGGNYPLYSSALMLVTTAKAAGVKRIAACTPAMKGRREIHPLTAAAMSQAGADEIYAVGGVQAIAAFAYGTEQIAPVDLIVGPGNRYVSEAKRQCYGQVGIDFVAGPSEVLIIADESARAGLVAADLLAQCEHDVFAQGMLVTTDAALGGAVIAEVERRLETLASAGIARRSWQDYGEVAVAATLDEAADYANTRAPEHLELQTAAPEALVPKLCNYGALFLGPWSAEVFGDYASGPNHTLPTLGAARYSGGVSVGTFLKTLSHQTLSAAAAASLAPLVSALAQGEGLAAHAAAAAARLISVSPPQ
jgi:histidinol dehydrogenase